MSSEETKEPAPARKPLKFEQGNFDTDADITADRVIGFVKIQDLGDAVQTKFSISTLVRVMPILKEMDKAGYIADEFPECVPEEKESVKMLENLTSGLHDMEGRH